MNTQEQQLMWLLEFAQMDLGQLKDWESLKLRTEVSEFLSPNAGSIHVMLKPYDSPMEADPSSLKKVQDEVYRLLRSFTAETIDLYVHDSGGKLQRIPSSRELNLVLIPVFDKTKLSSLVIKGWLEDLLTASGLLLLLAPGSTLAARIARCPECKRLFLRVRKQIYCTKRCINRVTRREWLKDPVNQKKESKWAHDRYERRVQAKSGAKVRVNRRPRKKKGLTK